MDQNSCFSSICAQYRVDQSMFDSKANAFEFSKFGLATNEQWWCLSDQYVFLLIKSY
jgi:hypothetical protein